jgi:hypothetical protein
MEKRISSGRFNSKQRELTQDKKDHHRKDGSGGSLLEWLLRSIKMRGRNEKRNNSLFSLEGRPRGGVPGGVSLD